MKIIFQKFLNLFGYRVSSIKKNNIKDFDDTLKKIFKQSNLNIIDIGANTGQSIDRFKKLFNKSKIYSIEPSKYAFNKLKKNYNNIKDVFLYNFAIGDKNQKKIFFDYENNVLSGFNKLNKQNRLKNKLNKQIVSVSTLDNFCKKNKLKNIHILKIDTQGNEAKVLKGSSKSIRMGIFNIIELEIIMGDYYEEYSNFYEIEKYLVNNNYRLIALDKRLNFFNDKRLYCNALYIRKDLYKKL
tara:strand:+ start:4718 stop:5440 length:723 start_codon:yes stop_codon:yes gene_type:complete